MRLRSASGRFHVDVSVIGHAERWVAVASISGDHEVGTGHTLEDALRAALTSLEPVVDELVESGRA